MADQTGGMVLGDVLYLSTLRLPRSLLDHFGEISPRLQVEQRPCTRPEEIPAEVWSKVQILHTNTVIPNPRDAPFLGLVQLDTAGVDHVTDTPLWTETGIPVSTIRGVSARWMAEYVVMMILAFSHNLPEMLRLQGRRCWPDPRTRWRTFGPTPLVGAKVVVVGFGRIGRAIGDLCCLLGMHVVGVRRRMPGAPSARPARPVVAEEGSGSGVFPRGTIEEVPVSALRDAVEGARYIVVVTPLTPETVGLIDRDLISAMTGQTVIINVARGGIVDEPAVLAALDAGRLGGAAFDVFAREPLPPESPLWHARDLVVSPHVAGFAGDYLAQIETLVGENVRRYLEGEPLLNLADRRAGY